MEIIRFYPNFNGIYRLVKHCFQPWWLKRDLKKEEGYVSWGLGVDAPFFFSSKFPIGNQSITITGFQRTHDNLSPIKYSIVKMSKLGTSIKYFDSVIFYGDQSNREFEHSFNLPNGTGYQLEVFNYCKCHSSGTVRIIQNEGTKEDQLVTAGD